MNRREQTKRKFSATVTVDVEIEVEEDLLAEMMTEEWQSQFYRFDNNRDDAVAHLVYNLAQGRSLTSLDGFAHRKPDDAKIVNMDWEVDDNLGEVRGEPGDPVK